MITELQELHRLYNKHEIGKTWSATTSSHFSAITQCACGDFLIWNCVELVWEPVYGNVCAQLINSNPDLYMMLKAWWPDRYIPAGVEGHACGWDKVQSYVNGNIVAAMRDQIDMRPCLNSTQDMENIYSLNYPNLAHPNIRAQQVAAPRHNTAASSIHHFLDALKGF